MALSTNYDALRDHIDFRSVDGYVHVGQGTDDLLRYLTRVDGEDNCYAFMYDGDKTILSVPPRYVREAELNFPGDVIVQIGSDESISDTITAQFGDKPSLAIPDTMSVGIHRTLAAFATTEVIDEPSTVWCQKNPDEISAIRELADSVQRAIALAETVLSEALVQDNTLIWEGGELTTDRLRTVIRKSLAESGFSDYGNIIIGAGLSCADLHFTGSDRIAPHEPVLIDLSPRSSIGYYGDMTRTFVPGTPPDWAREMYTAVNDALKAAHDTLATGSGVTAGKLYEAMAETLESHGYETDISETCDEAIGLTHGTGHGIGVRLHEKPFQFAGSKSILECGDVFTVEPGVYDTKRGGIRLENMIHLTADGYENLTKYPCQIEPMARENG